MAPRGWMYSNISTYSLVLGRALAVDLPMLESIHCANTIYTGDAAPLFTCRLTRIQHLRICRAIVSSRVFCWGCTRRDGGRSQTTRKLSSTIQAQTLRVKQDGATASLACVPQTHCWAPTIRTKFGLTISPLVQHRSLPVRSLTQA